jgi:prevent-host-death family protein
MEVNIHEAKRRLSRLIARAMDGEEIIIAKAGQPLVRLVRIEDQNPILGSAEGEIRFQEGWDAPLPLKEVEEIFGG